MRKLAFSFLFLSCLAAAQPAPPTLIGNVPGRTTVSLDGAWHTIVDPYETGFNSRFYEDDKPKNKSELVEYNFDASPTLNVPGDWNMQRENLYFYEGPLWYERHFTYHKRPHTRAFLNFGAANYLARVWLGGKKLGEHIGGFTPFQFEITTDVAEGDNSIVVEVNNARRMDAVPALATDWWNYGGLTRSVQIVEVPDTFVQNYLLQLSKAAPDEISGWVELNGAKAPQPITVEIPELGITKAALTDASGRAQFRFAAKPELWTPESPKLYRVIVSSGGDKVEDRIGFRTIETRGTQILLNGKPIFLRGISMHEEAPFREGRAFSEKDDRQLLEWAKELGCNFVRMAHYPHNETMVRLADSMGLLLWEEIPVYWDTAWENLATLQNAQEQLRDVIARDQNRASIILWSLSNETPPTPPRLEFLKSLAAYARTQDSTRLLTSAMNHFDHGGGDHNVLSDPIGEYLDVLGLNEYLGWYHGKPEDADRTTWQISPEKPLIVSEFGGDALFGKHGDKDERWTEEYQANLFERQIGMLRKIPSMVGMSPWLLMDFHSPRRPLPRIQDYHNRKGLISSQGQHKQAFYVLQKYYREMGAK